MTRRFTVSTDPRSQRAAAKRVLAAVPEGSWDYARATERLIRAIIGKRFDEPYTADDLLAWLREQGVALQPQRDGDLYDLCALPVTLYVITREEWTSVKAPTLLATLEAAVRAVAGES